MGESQIFVGRQPILDRNRKVVAYELLFRASANADKAVFEEQGVASLRVIINSFMSIGIDRVLGDCKGYINVVGQMIMSDIVEALPKERVVIEILETVEVGEALRTRCAELKAKGFVLALDDWVCRDPRESLLGLVEIVKVDLLEVPRERWRSVVRHLRKHKVQLLAEKVETLEDFQICYDLGFELFQGYFFAVPQVLEGGSIDPARVVVLDLLQQLIADEPNRVICETLKLNALLGVNLLRLVNSASLAPATKIGRVEDALNYIGRENMKRWFFMLLYAGGGKQGITHPLMQAATRRGRLMELLALGLIEGDAGTPQADTAFLVGMLSLVDALLGRPLEEVILQLNLADELQAALLKGEGVIGKLLDLVRIVEKADFDSMDAILAELGLDIPFLQECDNRAYAWVHGLSQTDGSGPEI